MTKKQLQKQIDELGKSQIETFRRLAVIEQLLHIKKTDEVRYIGYDFAYTTTTKSASAFIEEVEKRLGIEYKVTESKREEGYVKKEDVLTTTTSKWMDFKYPVAPNNVKQSKKPLKSKK